MPRYSRLSQERLDTGHTAIRQVFNEVIKVFDCTILCGFRAEEEQDTAFVSGDSRCEWPNSSHNGLPSLAIDAAPYYIQRPHVRWDSSSLTRWYYFGGVVVTIAHNLGITIRWGGDWDRDTYVRDQEFNDLPHFEYIISP